MGLLGGRFRGNLFGKQPHCLNIAVASFLGCLGLGFSGLLYSGRNGLGRPAQLYGIRACGGLRFRLIRFLSRCFRWLGHGLSGRRVRYGVYHFGEPSIAISSKSRDSSPLNSPTLPRPPTMRARNPEITHRAVPGPNPRPRPAVELPAPARMAQARQSRAGWRGLVFRAIE